MDLVQEKCVPCRGGEPALGPEQIKEYLAEAPEWMLVKRDEEDAYDRYG